MIPRAAARPPVQPLCKPVTKLYHLISAGCGSCILFIVTTIIVYKLSLPVFLENFDPEGDVPSDTRYLPKADRTYSGRHILCHKFEGGLGSLLFQYAALLGISQNENRILVGNGDMGLQTVLKGTRYKVEKSQCRNVVHIKEIACCRFDEKLTNLDRGKNYEIVGVLNSWKYFKDSVEDIRKAIVLQVIEFITLVLTSQISQVD